MWASYFLGYPRPSGMRLLRVFTAGKNGASVAVPGLSCQPSFVCLQGSSDFLVREELVQPFVVMLEARGAGQVDQPHDFVPRLAVGV